MLKSRDLSGLAGPVERQFTVNNRLVLQLAIPMTLAYLSTPLLGLVDTAVVGQYGNASLIGGLAIGAIIVDLIFTTFNFLRSGTTGLAAQAMGAEDEKEKQAILMRSLTIAGVSGFSLILASPLLLMLGLWFMAPGEEVAAATRTYFLIRVLSTPFAFANYVVLGWMIGLGRAFTALGLQTLLNGLNIVLSVYLGLYLDWGIEGVATATVIGEVVTAVVGLWICWRMLDHSVRPSRARVMEKPAWLRLVSLNSDIMIRSFALLFAFTWFTAEGARYGDVTLAANAILMHFFITSGYFLDGLATAAEQIVGRSIGARYRNGFWRGFWLTLGWGAALAFACTLIYVIAGEPLVRLITTSDEVRAVAIENLWWVAFIPLTGVLAFHMDGVFIGATWSRDMSIMMILSLAGFLATVWVTREPLANQGLWLSLHVFLLLRGILLCTRLLPRTRQTFA